MILSYHGDLGNSATTITALLHPTPLVNPENIYYLTLYFRLVYHTPMQSMDVNQSCAALQFQKDNIPKRLFVNHVIVGDKLDSLLRRFCKIIFNAIAVAVSVNLFPLYRSFSAGFTKE